MRACLHVPNEFYKPTDRNSYEIHSSRVELG